MTLVVAGVIFSMMHWSNTSNVHLPKTRPGKPTIVAAPVPADYRVAKREGVLRVAAEFVNTAVRESTSRCRTTLPRRRCAAASHGGRGRRSDIPVQPYPLESARYKLKGSFTDSVWIQVALYPDRKHKSVPAAVFDLTLKPFRDGGARHWLVDSWAPAGYTGIPSGPLGSDRGPARRTSSTRASSPRSGFSFR